jgi:hypothetical protein
MLKPLSAPPPDLDQRAVGGPICGRSRDRRLAQQIAGARCLVHCEIHLCEAECLHRIRAGSKPKLGCVAGESLGVSRHQLIIACGRPLAPTSRLIAASDVSKDARELSGVIRIVR